MDGAFETSAIADSCCDSPPPIDDAPPTWTPTARACTPDEQAAIARLESEIIEYCGHLNAATYRWLTLLAEFDVVRGWAGPGTRSCAHWLNWKCGLELGAAREKLRVAHALRDLPKLAAAMAAGELSYSKARALTRVATPAIEDPLLNVARHGTTAHVERLVRAFRRVREVENVARDERQHRARGVNWHVDEDGSYVFRLTLPVEGGARFLKALDAAVDAMPAPKVTAEVYAPGCPASRAPQNATWSVRRADAVALLAESFLARGPAEQPGAERTTLVVQVDAEAYAAHRRESGGGSEPRAPAVEPTDVSAETSAAGARVFEGDAEDCVEGYAQCCVEHGPALPLETARRLGCDATVIRLVVDAEGAPLDVGRRTRTIPPALRRALAARDRGCRYPGCTATRYVDGHHLRHWAQGGETKLANLVLLCRYHHRLVHEGGASVEVLDGGTLRFTAPDGRVLGEQSERTKRRADAGGVSAETSELAIVVENRARGLAIDGRTAATRWCGERMDYAMAIDGLVWAEQRASAGESS